MRRFRHVNATSWASASDLVREHRGAARPLAGGTDLLGVLKGGILESYPELVVNLKSIPGFARVEERKGALTLGAGCRLGDLERLSVLQEGYPALAEAVRSVASPLIRNLATLGGNLCQDVRCWYYRYPDSIGGAMKCLRKGGDTCFAVKGENRYHSVFGGLGANAAACDRRSRRGGDVPRCLERLRVGAGRACTACACYAVGPSDVAPVLVMLGAEVLTTERTLPAADLLTATLHPSQILREGELMRGVRVPKAKGVSHYDKLRVRNAIDFATVSLASRFVVAGGKMKEVSIVFGGVAPVPRRAIAAEEFLKGKKVDEALIERATDLAADGASAMRDNEYKLHHVKHLLREAIRRAAGFY